MPCSQLHRYALKQSVQDHTLGTGVNLSVEYFRIISDMSVYYYVIVSVGLGDGHISVVDSVTI